MENKTSFEKANPIFNTAKMTLYWLAQSGVPNARIYLHETGFDREFNPSTIPAFEACALPNTIGQEIRYTAINDLVRQAGNKNILDLACGYSPRGLDMIEEGYRYHGGDLQMVVPQIAPIVKKLAKDKADMVSYSVVDVTDYNSVMAAADQLTGPITVITEGLMVYLSEYEKRSLCSNIASVLQKHGGCWICPDFNTKEYVMEVSTLFVGEHALEAVKNTMKQYAEKSGGNLTKDMSVDVASNMEIFSDAGLEVEILPFGTDDIKLFSYSLMEEEKRVALRRLFKKGSIWKIALKKVCQSSTSTPDTHASGFSANLQIENDALSVTIVGRLDSLTAPLLIEKYEGIEREGAIRSVTFDMEHLSYVSSAGLRVLTMIRDSVDGNAVVKNSNGTVAEILKQADFTVHPAKSAKTSQKLNITRSQFD